MKQDIIAAEYIASYAPKYKLAYCPSDDIYFLTLGVRKILNFRISDDFNVIELEEDSSDLLGKSIGYDSRLLKEIKLSI